MDQVDGAALHLCTFCDDTLLQDSRVQQLKLQVCGPHPQRYRGPATSVAQINRRAYLFCILTVYFRS